MNTGAEALCFNLVRISTLCLQSCTYLSTPDKFFQCCLLDFCVECGPGVALEVETHVSVACNLMVRA